MSDQVEARLVAIENALALPHTASAEGGAVTAELRLRVAELEKALARANYRILHLTKGIDELRSKAEQAEKTK